MFGPGGLRAPSPRSRGVVALNLGSSLRLIAVLLICVLSLLCSGSRFGSAQTGAGLGGGLVALTDSVDFGVFRNILDHAQVTADAETLLGRLPCIGFQFEQIAATPRGDREYRLIMTFDSATAGTAQMLRGVYRYSAAGGLEPTLPPDSLNCWVEGYDSSGTTAEPVVESNDALSFLRYVVVDRLDYVRATILDRARAEVVGMSVIGPPGVGSLGVVQFELEQQGRPAGSIVFFAAKLSQSEYGPLFVLN